MKIKSEKVVAKAHYRHKINLNRMNAHSEGQNTEKNICIVFERNNKRTKKGVWKSDKHSFVGVEAKQKNNE